MCILNGKWAEKIKKDIFLNFKSKSDKYKKKTEGRNQKQI